MIAHKYANPFTALYNLELLQAGTAGMTLGVFDRSPPNGGPAASILSERLDPIIQRLYDTSLASYQQLVRSDDFVRFFSQATPIDVIERSSIGSRPARRTGQRSFKDLRAIPWVFSWSQARFFLTGWYGVGVALEQLEKDSPDDFATLSRYAERFMPFRYIITNVSTAIAIADVEIMRQYAALVEDRALADEYLQQIVGECYRTRDMLERLYGQKLKERRPRMYTMIGFRSERLRQLHRLQIEQLRRWRSLQAADRAAEAEEMLPDLLLVLNAIASGLGTTG